MWSLFHFQSKVVLEQMHSAPMNWDHTQWQKLVQILTFINLFLYLYGTKNNKLFEGLLQLFYILLEPLRDLSINFWTRISQKIMSV